MRFIDLFAGLGGFHVALKDLGHKCVFASEIDETLRSLYKTNFGMEAAGDVCQIEASEIPAHDILCAGFPCQPFSKARDPSDTAHSALSELYLQILKVIRYHHPSYLILENVPNLERHKDGQTWERIRGLLEAEGYDVRMAKLSPHEFGIPQIRSRIYIVGGLTPLRGFDWPRKSSVQPSIDSVLDDHPTDARCLPEQVARCLDAWQAFLDRVPPCEKIPHPLWAMEFGATYPFETTTPWATSDEDLRECRGSLGCRLAEGITRQEMLALLPSHARTRQSHFPSWKVRFIRRNREFYGRHREWLDDWIGMISEFPASFQKLEWNCQEKDPRIEVRRIRDYILQIRPSGVRVKRRTTAPSLVAMTATQVPIIAWQNRYMTPTECMRLQSMEDLTLPGSVGLAYRALGNAVNVQVARLVASALIDRAEVMTDASLDGQPDTADL